MTDPRTVRAHHAIETMAAGILDVYDDLAVMYETDPRASEFIDRRLRREFEIGQPMLARVAAARQFDGERTRLIAAPDDRRLVLAKTALLFMLGDRERPELTFCAHRGPGDVFDADEATIAMIATRDVVCLACGAARAHDKARRALLDADNTCDVCRVPQLSLTQHSAVLGALFVQFFAGDCCADFFEIFGAFEVTPTVGRNEPCPCGSNRKFKYCHGTAQP
jgi:hypothetical protein